MLEEIYKVKKLNTPVDIKVNVPGSKSMTNRALLMAAMSDGKTTLKGVLFSDDSRYFLSSLKSLGFNVDVDENNKSVTLWGMKGEIPEKNGTIYVGSAGTAARFLTAMLALSDGEYTINASKQMSKRPMKPLFDALSDMGAKFTYLNEEGFLPVHVVGSKAVCNETTIDISKSTQFLSALLMTAPMLKNGLDIHISSEKKDGAYIRITRTMMEEFGCKASFKNGIYHIEKGQSYNCGVYQIEPDVSAACYFYAMAAVCGGNAIVYNVHKNSMQGDIKFLDVLEKMGCSVLDEEEGIKVTRNKDVEFVAVDIDMNDFSDQTMTLAAIAPFAKGVTHIRNIEHISLQESDRLQAIISNLTNIGIKCEREEKGIVIYPGEIRGGNIETYEDHRMAMAFAITGLMVDGIIIRNPMCCRKTFENYFDIMDDITNNK